jgi:hypothetical protein
MIVGNVLWAIAADGMNSAAKQAANAARVFLERSAEVCNFHHSIRISVIP